jgi:hypothetical protein
MANHFSALKRARQTEKRTARNRANTSRLRSALRDLRESLAKGDKQGAEFSANCLRPRQSRPEGRAPREHRVALQVPFERALERGREEVTARRSENDLEVFL